MGQLTAVVRTAYGGDKCRDMEFKAFRLADIPCEDYWEIR